MTTSHSPAPPSPSSSSGASFSSLPRWRQFLSELCHTARHLGATLNWHRDPDFETRMHALRKDRERIENEILRVRSDSERIEKETEQLRRETKRLKELNSRLDSLLRSPDSSSPTPPAADCS